jgi:hypothetical protein
LTDVARVGLQGVAYLVLRIRAPIHLVFVGEPAGKRLLTRRNGYCYRIRLARAWVGPPQSAGWAARKTPMQTYEFQFRCQAALALAFGKIMACEYVEDCHVHYRFLRLRFRAPDGPTTQRLFDRIEFDGNVVRSSTVSENRRWTPWPESPEPDGPVG